MNNVQSEIASVYSTFPSEEEARRIDHDAIRRDLIDEGASRVQIEPQIIRATRARSETISEDLSALDALAAYCEAQQIHHERRDQMLKQLREWSNE